MSYQINLKTIKQNFYSFENTEFIKKYIEKYNPQYLNVNINQIQTNIFNEFNIDEYPGIKCNEDFVILLNKSVFDTVLVKKDEIKQELIVREKVRVKEGVKDSRVDCVPKTTFHFFSDTFEMAKSPLTLNTQNKTLQFKDFRINNILYNVNEKLVFSIIQNLVKTDFIIHTGYYDLHTFIKTVNDKLNKYNINIEYIDIKNRICIKSNEKFDLIINNIACNYIGFDNNLKYLNNNCYIGVFEPNFNTHDDIYIQLYEASSQEKTQHNIIKTNLRYQTSKNFDYFMVINQKISNEIKCKNNEFRFYFKFYYKLNNYFYEITQNVVFDFKIELD